MHLIGLNKGGATAALGLRSAYPDASYSVASIDRKLFQTQPSSEDTTSDRAFEITDWDIPKGILDVSNTQFIVCDVAPGSGQSAGRLARQLCQEFPELTVNQIDVLALLAAPAAADHLLEGEQPRVGRLITGYLGSGLESSGMILTPSPKGYRIALDNVESAIDMGWTHSQHERFDQRQALMSESINDALPLQPISE